MILRAFSRTTGYRHESIPAAVAAVDALCRRHGHVLEASEDPASLEDLSGVAAVVFLHPSGDVLTPPARRSLLSFVESGGGFAAVHAAADAEPGWPGYVRLLGARFASHPHEQWLPATVAVVDRDHPSTRDLPDPWQWHEEWYAFDRSVRGERRVLLDVDETRYLTTQQGAMGPDHPLSWSGTLGRGRTWYTSLGHHEAAYRDDAFLGHLWGGIDSVLPVAP